MADANARLEFLWKASHMLLSQCPGASAHYMSQFLSLANSRDLRLHEDIQSKSCAACGSIFVPGVNSKVRIAPVNETKLEREKRKKADRKKAKMEKRKQSDRSNVEMTANSTLDTPTRKQQNQPDISLQKPARKVIRITPYTELAQQQQQQRRTTGGNHADGNSIKKNDKRASQLLNHVIYSCQRCNRDTELPGTKEGYLNSRIKTPKPVSQRRKLKKEKEQAAVASISTSNLTVPAPALSASIQGPLKSTTTKRPASTVSSPALPDIKRPKQSNSMPASPIGGLSKASSAASSAASSPVSSPRLPGPDNGKLGGGGGSSNRKKKKGGLASLLANQQKPKDPPNDGAGGSSGDSVLANFLMGL
ncbi:hypothetical protein BGX27_000996 [Mortierella sp. AM989]|nr:hypothetical protein BGX27_000996 [Mortierella sp. AM989]